MKSPCKCTKLARVIIQQEFAGEFEHIHWTVQGEPPSVDALTANVLFAALREVV
jgi:hypothetical protein